MRPTSWCASRSAAILYGKDRHFEPILTQTGSSFRSDLVYGALTWRTMWNARHILG
jgi:hypothetical protein